MSIGEENPVRTRESLAPDDSSGRRGDRRLYEAPVVHRTSLSLVVNGNAGSIRDGVSGTRL